MPRSITQIIISLLLGCLFSCNDMHFQALPEEKDITFEGTARKPQQSAYRPGDSTDIQLDLTSSDAEAREAKFKVVSWSVSDGKQGTLDASSISLGSNTLHYTPKEPGTHDLTLRVAVEGEEEHSQTFHYTIEVPAAEWRATGRGDSEGYVTLTIDDAPEAWHTEPWRIQSTRWSKGLRGILVNSPTQVQLGDNALPITLQKIALKEIPQVHFNLQGPDKALQSITIDLRGICVAQLEEAYSEEYIKMLNEHNKAVRRQASTYQGNLTGNDRAEALRILRRHLDKTAQLREKAEAQLASLASNLNILQEPDRSGLAVLNARRTDLQHALEKLNESTSILQPMVDQLNDSDHGPIDPWGVLYQALTQRQYDEASMTTHMKNPLLSDSDVVNKEGDQNKTLLLLAIEQEHIALSRCLIQQGADLSVRNHAGKTLFQIATEAGNGAATALLVSAGAKQDADPDWQVWSNYETAAQQILLTIGDTPESLQQTRDTQAQWRITNITWSEGLSGQIDPRLVLQHGENRIPTDINMGTITEIPTLQILIQGPDRAFRSITVDLREVCVAILRDKEVALASKAAHIDAHIQETENTLIRDTEINPKSNREKQMEIEALLAQIKAFQEQYERDLQAFSRNLDTLGITRLQERLALFNSNNDRLRNAIENLKSARAQLQQQWDARFGADKWCKYFGEVGSEPLVPAHIDALLNQPCKLFPGKKVYETHLLTLIPATVDGIPLTLNSFQEVLRKSKEAGHNSAEYWNYCDNVQEQFGEKTCEASHWILMTRDVIPGSRNKSYEKQCSLVEKTAKNTSIPYALPLILEGVVSTLCYHVDTGKELFPYKGPTTMSRCQERLARGFTVSFGRFRNSRLDISNEHSHEYTITGVAASVY